ncbi:hypothetical protein IscW_ISCW020187 [Ixodes scapularis]|uniref:Phospholipase A2-like central domain-containing protein n=1 Tax=Ixodes scapularis TaxID=6945 RepID=B7PZG6_IXOSC|nr:hypothetical protein IscW_ISCW020187 [Ixodes scapularis]|eukprot:XP_002405251.1 hypothetical protein IscW_ISCW020187 [Ixodes scapularis]
MKYVVDGVDREHGSIPPDDAWMAWQFRSCLKMGNNAASHMVGKLYFNIVQTKCFTFKKQDVCHRRSWWGKCVQRGLGALGGTRQGYVVSRQPGRTRARPSNKEQRTAVCAHVQPPPGT